MPRIKPVDEKTATPAQAEVLTTVKGKMGVVPNIIATMANSPAVATAYLGASQALSTGSLTAALREQIALTVAETNQCEYCLAAHTALGKGAGLDDAAINAARRASATGEKENAALRFARKIVDDRGQVTDTDVEQLRRLGYTEGEIGEIVANVVFNIFTNYFNHVAETEVDFPAAPALAAA